MNYETTAKINASEILLLKVSITGAMNILVSCLRSINNEIMAISKRLECIKEIDPSHKAYLKEISTPHVGLLHHNFYRAEAAIRDMAERTKEIPLQRFTLETTMPTLGNTTENRSIVTILRKKAFLQEMTVQIPGNPVSIEDFLKNIPYIAKYTINCLSLLRPVATNEQMQEIFEKLSIMSDNCEKIHRLMLQMPKEQVLGTRYSVDLEPQD